MGEDAKTRAERREQRAETIHRTQLFGGTTTAEEVHRSLAFPVDAFCKCGSRKLAIRARTFMPHVDLVQHHGEMAMLIASRNGGRIPVANMEGPGGDVVKMVRIGDAYACDMCKAALQRAAAKMPSYVYVHWDFGPGPEKPIVQVVS